MHFLTYFHNKPYIWRTQQISTKALYTVDNCGQLCCRKRLKNTFVRQKSKPRKAPSLPFKTVKSGRMSPIHYDYLENSSMLHLTVCQQRTNGWCAGSKCEHAKRHFAAGETSKEKKLGGNKEHRSHDKSTIASCFYFKIIL